MRTLHVDTGRELRGGQWQALYLIERLSDAVLLARAGSPLFAEAARRKVEVRALSFRALAAGARRAIWCTSTMRGRIRWRRSLA